MKSYAASRIAERRFCIPASPAADALGTRDDAAAGLLECLNPFSDQIFQLLCREPPGIGMPGSAIHNQAAGDATPQPPAILAAVAGREPIAGVVISFSGKGGWISQLCVATFPGSPRFRQLLDLLPVFRLDDGWMLAVMDRVFVPDAAIIIPIRQQFPKAAIFNIVGACCA